jgi:hypothetical protein
MSNASEVTRKAPVDLDGFSGGYSEPPRGGDDDGGGSSSGFPGATKIKFDIHTAKWIDANGDEMIHGAVALDVVNRVQKWSPEAGPPLETIALAPGEKWPDIATMNEACMCNDKACKNAGTCQGKGTCKGEWYEKFGKMVGPYQGEHVVRFVNPDTMAAYWWPSPTSTVGACICVRQLMEQTTLKRKFTGVPCYAQVEFTHTFMPTQYGGRERPHLVIKGFGTFGDGGFKLLPNIVPTAKQITGDSIEY